MWRLADLSLWKIHAAFTQVPVNYWTNTQSVTLSASVLSANVTAEVGKIQTSGESDRDTDVSVLLWKEKKMEPVHADLESPSNHDDPSVSHLKMST